MISATSRKIMLLYDIVPLALSYASDLSRAHVWWIFSGFLLTLQACSPALHSFGFLEEVIHTVTQISYRYSWHLQRQDIFKLTVTNRHIDMMRIALTTSKCVIILYQELSDISFHLRLQLDIASLPCCVLHLLGAPWSVAKRTELQCQNECKRGEIISYMIFERFGSLFSGCSCNVCQWDFRLIAAVVEFFLGWKHWTGLPMVCKLKFLNKTKMQTA